METMVGETMRPMCYIDDGGLVSSGARVGVGSCSPACSPLTHCFHIAPMHDIWESGALHVGKLGACGGVVWCV